METVKKYLRRYFIDAMGAMALGLFASLRIGTIFGTLAKYTGLDFLNVIATYAKAATGMAIGVAIAHKLGADPLVIFSCAGVGAMSTAMGAVISQSGGIVKWAATANEGIGNIFYSAGPAGAFFAVIIAAEIGRLVSKKTKVENRPGVTVDKQWVDTNIGLLLMDMPGVLWPKFDDRTIGENLALTGAIRDKILDIETLAIVLCSRLRKQYPDLLSQRYKLGDMVAYENYTDLELFEVIGKKRGFLISGGEIDYERTANMLLEEFRSAKIGKITLDRI